MVVPAVAVPPSFMDINSASITNTNSNMDPIRFIAGQNNHLTITNDGEIGKEELVYVDSDPSQFQYIDYEHSFVSNANPNGIVDFNNQIRIFGSVYADYEHMKKYAKNNNLSFEQVRI